MKTILVLTFLLLFSIPLQAMDKDPIKDFSMRQNQEFSSQRCVSLKDAYFRTKALLVNNPEDFDLKEQLQSIETELARCPDSSNSINNRY